MSRVIYLVLIIAICTSCKSLYDSSEFGAGRFCFYYSKNKKLGNELIFNSDSTFSLNFYGGEYNSACSGQWKFVGKNIIRIECFAEKDPFAITSANYMNLRIRDITIIDANRLKMPIINNVKRKYVVLEREK